MMWLLDRLHWWRLNRRSNRLIKQGITIRSEYPVIIAIGQCERVSTAVYIGNEPAIIIGFSPVVRGSQMTCERLYQLNWMTDDGFPVYLAKGLRQVS